MSIINEIMNDIYNAKTNNEEITSIHLCLDDMMELRREVDAKVQVCSEPNIEGVSETFMGIPIKCCEVINDR